MTKFVNLTPHAVNLLLSDREIVIPPFGTLARCSVDRQVVGSVEFEGALVPLIRTVLGDLVGLPTPEEGTIYIVSLQAAQCAAREGRSADIVIPDDAVRDSSGRIVGCRALACQ